jgi:ADP-L-glycero-D-manno-heptose 6-epimerase
MTAQHRPRTIVTGGAGFIGSALVWQLNRLGEDDILVVDRLGHTDKWRNLRPLRFADYIEADAFLEAVLAAGGDRFADVGTVYHMGACSSTTETDAAYLIRNNYEYTKRLAHWAVARGVRFVYASSAATYGALEEDLSEARPLASLRPLNMYGYSKQLFDLYAERTGLLERIVGLKYFNVFGPNEAHKGDMRSLVAKAYEQVGATGRLRLFRSHRPDYRDGEQRRDFLYVRDAVAMTVHLATAAGASGIYNIGAGHAHTWLELAAAIFAAMRVPPAIEFVDMPDAIRPRYQYHTRAVIDRLRGTGYASPVTPLADAVADYVHNYLAPGVRLGEEPARAAAGGA